MKWATFTFYLYISCPCTNRTLLVPFGALVLLVGWQEGRLICKKSRTRNTQRLLLRGGTFGRPGVAWSDLRKSYSSCSSSGGLVVLALYWVNFSQRDVTMFSVDDCFYSISALGVFHVMRYINVRYLLTYLLMTLKICILYTSVGLCRSSDIIHFWIWHDYVLGGNVLSVARLAVASSCCCADGRSVAQRFIDCEQLSGRHAELQNAFNAEMTTSQTRTRRQRATWMCVCVCSLKTRSCMLNGVCWYNTQRPSFCCSAVTIREAEMVTAGRGCRMLGMVVEVTKLITLIHLEQRSCRFFCCFFSAFTAELFGSSFSSPGNPHDYHPCLAYVACVDKDTSLSFGRFNVIQLFIILSFFHFHRQYRFPASCVLS